MMQYFCQQQLKVAVQPVGTVSFLTTWFLGKPPEAVYQYLVLIQLPGTDNLESAEVGNKFSTTEVPNVRVDLWTACIRSGHATN